ncbi:MAG: hypothetical protein MUF31_01075 [Akkermansiaceae bacterium]|jgi:hypothetical protein|nr:hypothetical protein [Akkermansiaceae bacterium]
MSLQRAILLLLLGSTLLARGSSDTFATATDLSSQSLPYFTFVPSGGSAEPGEPAHAGSPAAASRWFRWLAPASSPVRFQEYLNGNASRIAIYTGNAVNALTLVAQGTKSVDFPASANTIYHLAIDSPGGDVIGLETFPVGGADQRVDAEIIPSDLPRKIQGNNLFASAETSEVDWHPTIHPTASVWWKWTAGFSGAVVIDARRSNFEPRITVYQSLGGGQNIRVGSGFNSTAFLVEEGEEYFMSFDNSTYGPGRIEFWMESVPDGRPPNDDVANATDLGNASQICDGGWIFQATGQAGVAGEDGGFPEFGFFGSRTIWWKWTCPANGYYRFSQYGSTGGARISLFAGAPTMANFAGFSDTHEGVRLLATAGTVYWIQIYDSFFSASRVELNIHHATQEPQYFKELDRLGYFRMKGAMREPEADADGDGFANEIELACGANPEVIDIDEGKLPRLVANGNIRILSWNEDSAYTQPSIGLPMALRGESATDLEGPWEPQTTLVGPVPGNRFIPLPSGVRGFVRVRLKNPNWDP